MNEWMKSFSGMKRWYCFAIISGMNQYVKWTTYMKFEMKVQAIKKKSWSPWNISLFSFTLPLIASDWFAVYGGVLAFQLSRRIYHVLREDFSRRTQSGHGKNNLHIASGWVDTLYTRRIRGESFFVWTMIPWTNTYSVSMLFHKHGHGRRCPTSSFPHFPNPFLGAP